MNLNKVILTDVDDAILNWSDPFREWVISEKGYEAEGKLQDFVNIEAWLGCDLDTTRKLVEEFNTNPNYWPNFAPLPGAVEVVDRLVADGWKFVAITACATDQWTYDARFDNLRRVFGGAFDTLHCVGLAQSKVPYLTRYRPTYWVEDKWKHALDGADLGHKPFLMQYGHSAGHYDPRITNVNSWLEIEAAIQEVEYLKAS